MQVLGIRAAPKEVRYAILENDLGEIRFINADSENRLHFPSRLENPEEKVYWLYQEFVRILGLHPSVEYIVIKEPEFTRTKSSSKSGRSDREIAYYNGIILLVAAKCGKCVKIKRYKSIGTSNSQVLEFAEGKIGRTKHYWNRQIADAVASAWSEISS